MPRAGSIVDVPETPRGLGVRYLGIVYLTDCLPVLVPVAGMAAVDQH
jgi:hypothetical protein